ncbi:ABC transporter ATP-binding protein [Methylobacterium sp. 37f]|uniref:ABC transporter ATP-binding protein n=1 Tax=Methylobacterium sp. 37f TaxID=2817058 RepID=UPI001FFD773F|nr:ABC transporter ATP-binding protein [Methylobacterium sp. 37f]MCK2052922.1 ABC transporter ATP-binding protein [Methylobacterium sp. 37f]
MASTPDPAGRLTCTGLGKRFGAHAALADLDLTLEPGEFVCLLGPSGCGKSTLLRLIAGFETPTAGTIRLGGTDITADPPHRRPVNMMFQSYALFPHLSVAANIAYGLNGLGRAARAERVAELLRLVRLDGFAARRPDTLSGGQRQRVALARALAREPRVLLLDEPLGALDRALREETQGELRALQKRLGTGFLVVTHDPAEALALADRIGVMKDGRLVQIGDGASLYERPANRFVAALLGDVNLIPGRVLAREPGGLVTLETALGPLRASRVASDLAVGEGVIALRPERIALAGAPSGHDPALAGQVVETTYLGDRVRVQVRLADGSVWRVSAPTGSDTPAMGQTVAVTYAPERAWLMPAAG